MKKIIAILFPYTLYLHIFQLERYDLSRALPWIFRNFFKRSTQNKKPLVYTDKAKMIQRLSFIFAIIGFVVGFILGGLITGIIVLVVLLLQPYILISLSIIALKPYEALNRAKTIRDTRRKIASLDHTQVIGIAGSYGKTSVKDILYHLLKAHYKVLKTPLSYNTIFGIAQVVDLELSDTYDYFLCELGEFQRGDITEMCAMVMPLHGIMTGINNQHLERFKSIDNTIATIFELFDYLKNKGQKTVANHSNAFIKNEIIHRNASGDIISYGDSESMLQVKNISWNDAGTSFDLVSNKESVKIITPLLGNAHINNILGAATMAHQIGLPLSVIAERLQTVPKVPHRYEQKLFPNGYLLVDNSYSSNSDSFRESVALLKDLSRTYKIMVTPGMVELGNESDAIHRELGQLTSDVCTKLVLVGTSDRTRALAEGAGNKNIARLDDIRNLWSIIESFGYPPHETVILLENDLPDNY